MCTQVDISSDDDVAYEESVADVVGGAASVAPFIIYQFDHALIIER